MQTLADTLVNAFPFLYSKAEFQKPENKKIILQALGTLASTGHALPVRSGEALIGAEPLIQAASFNMKSQLDDAIRLYGLGEYDSAQSKVHSAIQNCFACHAAHQIGPRFPTTNNEIMGLATPNILGKAVVFGSLRQFEGALELIDKEGARAINKKSLTSDNLVKLYLVISLRSQQKFARATTFLNRFNDGKISGTLAKWFNDIKSWQTLTAAGNRGPIADYIAKRKKSDTAMKDDSLFVVYLLESYFLHNLPAPATSSAEAKATAFQQLAEDYAGLKFSPFETLPATYYRACANAAPESTISKQCLKLAGN